MFLKEMSYAQINFLAIRYLFLNAPPAVNDQWCVSGILLTNTIGFSVLVTAQCDPLPMAYRARTKRLVLCTHLGFEKRVLAVTRHYPCLAVLSKMWGI